MRPAWRHDARRGEVRVGAAAWLVASALGLCALALVALLWPRALPLDHVAADQTRTTRRAPAPPPPRPASSCETPHAESEPSCVHPSGREPHRRR